MPEILIIFILCAGIIVIGIILCIIIKVSHMSDDEQKRTMNDSWSSFVPTRSIKRTLSLKDYIIRDIQEKFKYLPSAVYLALICIAMYIFVCLLRYLFTMREVSQADERRKKIVGKIWHMLFCGTFVAYMYTLIMIVYYSREPGSRTGVADMVLWSNWGMTLQMHAYFIENIVLFIPFGLLFPLVFKNWMRWFTIPVGALISAAIEYTQLVTGRGYCQLDDFVTNTAGAAIGFFIYLILYAGWLVWKK